MATQNVSGESSVTQNDTGPDTSALISQARPSNGHNSALSQQNELYASQSISYADIKGLIPSFDGNPAELEHYLSTTDTMYNQLSDDRNKKLCVLAIRSKLNGKAFEAMRSAGYPMNWSEIREALRQKISPVSAESAYASLTQAQQSVSETIFEYTSRVNGLLHALNRATVDNAPHEAKEHIQRSNLHLAKKSFEFGLANAHIRTIVIASNKTTLAASSKLAQELVTSTHFDTESEDLIQEAIENEQIFS